MTRRADRLCDQKTEPRRAVRAPAANVAVPTDLAKDVIVGPTVGPVPATDLPTPKDLNLDPTAKDAETDAKDMKNTSAEVAGKVGRDASGHDGGGRKRKKGKKGSGGGGKG